VTVTMEGRVALVTGAGGGIGRAHALRLASLGAAVVVNDVGGDVRGTGASGAAAAVVAEIEALGGSAAASTDSIATAAGGEAAVGVALERCGRLDAVIHNAGILRDKSLHKLAPEDVSAVLDVHLVGGFNVLLPALRVMREARYGRIVLTTSASGLFGSFGQANSAAAKAGLVGLMNVAAVEGARHGIRVNALSPTALTRMTEGLIGEHADAFDPEHVAAVGAYLCSEACSITHTILSAGGGRIARIFLGVTPGIDAGPEPASADEVEARLDEIMALDDHVVPDDGHGEVALIDALLSARRAGPGSRPSR
jgi:NAD(P)-dependent dehydrogenase (short-subunit alcohol dehydrogenase family)